MYLNDYKPTVTQSGETYIVNYGLGECVYTYQIMVKIPETDERKIIAGHVNLLK